MVKLDVSKMHFMEEEDYRVLVALEMALRNHEIAPTALIEHIARLPHGGARRRLQQLLKQKIIHHENTHYHGYAMKYEAYDMLALHTFSRRETLTGVGSRVGCGKESDIFTVRIADGSEAILKLQRLGRCSFRSVSRNRDYKNGKARRGASWYYLSRLAAEKEFAFMRLLYDNGFPVPQPIDHNRHAIVMSVARGTMLNHWLHIEEGVAEGLYERCIALMVRLAESGLVHGDFNEFNLMVDEDAGITLIDLPQMVSVDHPNAAELFDRDVVNLTAFFERRWKIRRVLHPLLGDIQRRAALDHEAHASGFTRQSEAQLQDLLKQQVGFGEETPEDSDASDDVPSDDDIAEEAAVVEVQGASIEHAEPVAASEGSELEEEASSVKDNNNSAEVMAADSQKSATIARLAELRQRLLEQSAVPAECDAHVQARRTFRNADERQFQRSLKRNTQKGRDKKRVARQLRSAGDVLDAGLF